MKEIIKNRIGLALAAMTLLGSTMLAMSSGQRYREGDPEPTLNIPYFYIEKDKTLHIDREWYYTNCDSAEVSPPEY